MLDLIERMLTIAPQGMDGFFFWNSGSEAVEAALKLARQATKKSNIIVFDGGYHGRTFGTMGLTTSKSIYREGFGPFMPGIHVAPFPACNSCRIPHATTCCNEPFERLELLLKRQTTPSETAAILIEPILGEGGYIAPPKGFLPALRELCTKNNILMIVDEVQSGMGRTGSWWAVNDEGVIPDILVFAKVKKREKRFLVSFQILIFIFHGYTGNCKWFSFEWNYEFFQIDGKTTSWKYGWNLFRKCSRLRSSLCSD